MTYCLTIPAPSNIGIHDSESTRPVFSLPALQQPLELYISHCEIEKMHREQVRTLGVRVLPPDTASACLRPSVSSKLVLIQSYQILD